MTQSSSVMKKTDISEPASSAPTSKFINEPIANDTNEVTSEKTLDNQDEYSDYSPREITTLENFGAKLN
jgi:hypothetical protein